MEKDLKFQVHEETSHTCMLAAELTKCTVVSMKREVASRVREVIVPVCFALVWTQLEYFVPVYAHQH